MKYDLSVWTSIERLRNTVSGQAKTICGMSAFNAFMLLYAKNWFGLVINILTFFTGIIMIISKTKFDKLPPQ